MSGTVTISIEVELAWGVHDLGRYGHLSEDGQRERAYLDRLLELCDQLDVPVSFNVVGHLLLSRCSGTHEGPHPEGWFDEDPGTNLATDPLYYAPDVVDSIRARSVDHEVCTHTFSHVELGDVDSDTAAWEVDRAQRLHEDRIGRKTVSLVPPRHAAPSTNVLGDTDIEIVRKAVPTHPRTSIHRFVELTISPPSLPDLQVATDVAETYVTVYPSLTAPSLPRGQADSHPIFKPIPGSVRRGLERRRQAAITSQTADGERDVHLWCHLADLANDHQFPLVTAFLERIAARRDAGDVDLLTMAALNDRVRGDGGRPNGSTRRLQFGDSTVA